MRETTIKLLDEEKTIIKEEEIAENVKRIEITSEDKKGNIYESEIIFDIKNAKILKEKTRIIYYGPIKKRIFEIITILIIAFIISTIILVILKILNFIVRYDFIAVMLGIASFIIISEFMKIIVNKKFEKESRKNK